MAIYQPPDSVVVAIGAAYASTHLLECGRRLLREAHSARAQVGPLGLDADRVQHLEALLNGLDRLLQSKRAQKMDTALQMSEVRTLMAEGRGWLRTLRWAAGLNLAADTPALHRLASPEPELAEPYPRDFLAELERRLAAARELAPRLRDAGVGRAFIALGHRIATQLKTAIGPQDLRPQDLDLELRRLYIRKGTLLLELKRWSRMGALTFISNPERAGRWALPELEPEHAVPLSIGPGAAKN